MASTQPYDVLIIGCGILGVATAYSCVKSNLSTIVLEQYSTHQHQNGGSFGTSRAWRTAYTNPVYADMMMKSLEIWKDIEQKTSIKLLRYCGGLDFGPSHCKALKDLMNTLKINNHKFELLSAKQTMNRFYPIKIPLNYSSVYTPNHYGTINAEKALDSMVQCAKDLECNIKYNHKVVKIAKIGKNKYKIYTERNKIFVANHVVISCGAYKLPAIIDETDTDKNALNKRVSNISILIRNSLKATAFNVVYYRHKNKDKIPWMNENYPVWAEYNDKNVCDWYGMMTPRYTPFGMIYCHKIGDSASNVPKWRDSRMNDYDHIYKYVEQRFDDENMKIFECKKCYNTEIKDDNFIIDRMDKNENIYVLFGGHAFKHSPEIGEMVKNMIIDNKIPNHMFLLKRFVESKL